MDMNNMFLIRNILCGVKQNHLFSTKDWRTSLAGTKCMIIPTMDIFTRLPTFNHRITQMNTWKSNIVSIDACMIAQKKKSSFSKIQRRFPFATILAQMKNTDILAK